MYRYALWLPVPATAFMVSSYAWAAIVVAYYLLVLAITIDINPKEKSDFLWNFFAVACVALVLNLVVLVLDGVPLGVGAGT